MRSLGAENDGKRYVAVQPSGRSSQARPSNHPSSDGNDYMQVEDTKDKVYIYDLDKELAEVESDEDRPIFIPDIEKHVMKLPKAVLIGDDLKAVANNQMILYRAPTSLSIPEDKDSVRKAIIESRRRAQESQALKVPHTSNTFLPPKEGVNDASRSYLNGFRNSFDTNGAVEEDPDAMDIG